jgi:hypothetical protein
MADGENTPWHYVIVTRRNKRLLLDNNKCTINSDNKLMQKDNKLMIVEKCYCKFWELLLFIWSVNHGAECINNCE